MHLAVRGDDLAAEQIDRPVRIVGDAAAGFLDDQYRRRHVPGMQMVLPEPVESAGRDIAEVEGRGSQAPHALRFAEERGEDIDELAALFADAVREPGA